ncbi:hypothetical protein AB0J86_26645 [Micromonospora sp. NPDC049559]|uniref:hypothetical protein n=1 Tax=Micromonospora sp. NPDC049559 TaxID=3155923 RepID=UPI00343BABF7
MRKPRGKLFAAAVAGSLLALAVPGAAYAAYYGSETDYAAWTSDAPDSTSTCSEIIGGIVCFQPYGDLIFVKDRSADGYAVAADWYTSYAGPARTGSCVHKLTADGARWAVCNKDFTEGNVVHIRAARYSGGNPLDSSSWVGVFNG